MKKKIVCLFSLLIVFVLSSCNQSREEINSIKLSSQYISEDIVEIKASIERIFDTGQKVTWSLDWTYSYDGQPPVEDYVDISISSDTLTCYVYYYESYYEQAVITASCGNVYDQCFIDFNQKKAQDEIYFGSIGFYFSGIDEYVYFYDDSFNYNYNSLYLFDVIYNNQTINESYYGQWHFLQMAVQMDISFDEFIVHYLTVGSIGYFVTNYYIKLSDEVVDALEYYWDYEMNTNLHISGDYYDIWSISNLNEIFELELGDYYDGQAIWDAIYTIQIRECFDIKVEQFLYDDNDNIINSYDYYFIMYV